MKKFRRITIIALTLFVLVLNIPAVSVLAADADMDYGRTKLNSTQQYIYDALVNGCKDAKETIEIKLTGKAFDFNNDLKKTLNMFYSDTPEYFWYSGGWRANYDGTTLQVFLSYTMTGSVLNSAKTAYDKKVNALTKDLAGKSDYEKSKILHDRLIDAVTYVSTDNDQNAYGALVEGQAVCNGYARAYQHLMKEVGIPAWYVRGVSVNPATDAQIGHAWNIVKLNGKWCYTDVTWDDQEDCTFYEFFNITTEKMAQDHILDFDYASLVPQATSSDDVNYYKIEGREFTKYDQGKLVNLLKKDNNKTQIYINGDVTSFLRSVSNNVLTIGKEIGGKGAFQVSYSAAALKNAVIISFVVTSEGHVHQAQTTVKQVDSTCLSNGTIVHYICSCGLKFIDSACTNQVSDESALVIPAKAHVSSGWKNDAASHWKICTSCGSETAHTRGEHVDANQDNKCDTCSYALPVADAGGNIVVNGGNTNNTPSNSTTPNTSDANNTSSSAVDATSSATHNGSNERVNKDLYDDDDDEQEELPEETGGESFYMIWILVGSIFAALVVGCTICILVLKEK